MKYLFPLLFILLSSSCRNNPLYDETTYPSEEDFLANDTLAFYLEDLLWIPFGNSPNLSPFSTSPNTFGYSFRKTETGHYDFEASSAMRITVNSDLILAQSIRVRVRDIDPSELPGTLILNRLPDRYWSLRDQKQDKFFISTSDHPMVLNIPVFDTLQGRMEGFFEGRLVNQKDSLDVVRITEGRFSISF